MIQKRKKRLNDLGPRGTSPVFEFLLADEGSIFTQIDLRINHLKTKHKLFRKDAKRRAGSIHILRTFYVLREEERTLMSLPIVFLLRKLIWNCWIHVYKEQNAT